MVGYSPMEPIDLRANIARDQEITDDDMEVALLATVTDYSVYSNETLCALADKHAELNTQCPLDLSAEMDSRGIIMENN